MATVNTKQDERLAALEKQVKAIKEALKSGDPIEIAKLLAD